METAVLMILILVLAAAFLAFANGANDNFKGVASLYGSGLATYRQAIAWATVATAAGAVASLFVAEALAQRFTGKGLVPDTVVGSADFVLAVAGGAALTVMLATRLGFPISTTHGLLGALGGAGVVAAGPHALGAATLLKSFVLPLLLGPLLGVGLGGLAHLALRRLPLGRSGGDDACVCVDLAPPAQVAAGVVPFTVTGQSSLIQVGSIAQCESAGRSARVEAGRTADALHWLSAGAVSFARGLNDTPKIAALLLAAKALPPGWGPAIVAVAMAAGGLLAARRVAETMSHRITTLDRGEGLAANLSTATLVLAASAWSLPVSTTHVSVGSLFGIGLVTGEANRRTASGIVLSWLVTLPAAATFAALLYGLLTAVT